MTQKDYNIIKLIKTSVKAIDPKAQVIIFGSRARGDAKKESDWDILILINSNKVTNEIEDIFRDKLYDIELQSGQIISTFIYSKDYWENYLKYSPFYKKINTEGVKL